MPKGAFEFQGDDDLRFLRDELYEGSWALMLADLEARLELRPAVFKITENIREDIAAIKRLMAEDGDAPPPAKATKASARKPASAASGREKPAPKKKTKPTTKKKSASRRQSARKTPKSGGSGSGTGKKRGKSA